MEWLVVDMDVVAKSVAAWTPRIAGALLILLGFYLLSKFLCHMLRRAMRHMARAENLINLFVRSTRILLTIVAIVTALGTLGVDVSALVAGLGLTGFALGFALKDTISNLLSGALILLHRPFVVGDSITIAGFSGRVMQIDLRYTELVSEGDKILIPNAKLFTDPLTVHTKATELQE
jgi:small-conductance mechanosensitive channel